MTTYRYKWETSLNLTLKKNLIHCHIFIAADLEQTYVKVMGGLNEKGQTACSRSCVHGCAASAEAVALQVRKKKTFDNAALSAKGSLISAFAVPSSE